ncbi:DUF4270 domain-containing protein [Dokdonia sp. Hel_I_53]|uniref:DUF4270 domain-containing protein n=1 Tax=Dokdonia sp. Hel_I_53 TaxID=1566287 RepID=UPI00119BB903|nr:DUF4270 domain-containing protein [Dokdonia sp. Hel_I_53]TVZ52439.1 uncharacterized protein DUF4270 [Dokdonia sp. Hel_I_53]
MKVKNFVKQILAVIGFAFLIVACEEDFGTLGTDIVGEVNFDTNLAADFKVAAYSKNYADGTSFNGVQTNNLPAGVLGFYNDPVYGPTTASLLSQVTLSNYNPDFGNETVIDSVVFSMPYFSQIVDTDDEGNNTYAIDSLFGNSGDMKLSLYRSNYFLNSLDPDSDFENPAVYFSNEIGGFTGVEGELIFEHSEFSPSASEIELKTPVLDENGDPVVPEELEISERLSPRLRVRLDDPSENEDGVTLGAIDWNEVIINQEGQNVLLNQNSFVDYFRGLYFKAENIGGNGSYFIFNPLQSNITIYYSFTGENTNDDPDSISDNNTGNIVLNLGGVNAVQFDNDFTMSPIGAVDFNSNQNTVDGEENLFLKGGDGSIALIDLFGRDEDGFSEELEILRSCNVLIREANLIFYVDQENLGQEGTGVNEPERIFIYDFDNNSTLLDAALDPTTGATSGALDTRINHLGRLTREVDGDLTSAGVSYKLRLTQHINNIVRNDSTNVRLGLAVSQNVTALGNSLIGGQENIENNNRVPGSSVISPEGTILHGNASSVEAKRLKLRIYYTTTEEIDPNSPCGLILGL